MSGSEHNLRDKIKEWLSSEGYPVEFQTALNFFKKGFTVRQGHYAQCSEGPREVDILAYVTDAEHRLRVHHVIEMQVVRG